ncbi:HlyD family secretion protein [Pedobacter nyackensis]|uniref:HlyD family secretion protein n=1 Tax=Pedobacter nyackensis TaxID=475255 RepID=A0A1W2AKP2_9SPHI|nr:hypothetical protein [Pedobacter nyackensis]SMC61246.1 hypothetical protein SAMN04488101_101709 [Pedobacter nyackensis]
MKNIATLIVLVLVFGLTKAQSNREDIEIRWPKAEGWEFDEKLSVQTDFSRRHYKWDVKDDRKDSWQKVVMILNDDITEYTKPLDSIDVSHDLLKDKGILYTLLGENKIKPNPYRLISLENRTLKSEQTPVSTLIYIIDGKTCRHMVLVSMKTKKFPASFLKQWSEILLSSQIIPSRDGNFELTDDAYLDNKKVNGVSEFCVTASFKSNQVGHLLNGQSAKIVVDDFPELSLSGKVSEISNVKNAFPLSSPSSQSGNDVKRVERFTVTITVELPPADKDKFKDRMNCTVRVSTAPKK